ncbi:MAG: SMI1/KNR4 family protein [Planctomycetaceae bacterium]|nr:SMI1/KNR4 family protein [Planctomycetaceae bacterium]
MWPAQLLIIGETGTGDYFCMDVLGDVPGILQYNHQAVEFERIADSLAEFVEILHDTFDEEAAEEELTGDEMTDDEMTDEEDCDESEDLSSG